MNQSSREHLLINLMRYGIYSTEAIASNRRWARNSSLCNYQYREGRTELANPHYSKDLAKVTRKSKCVEFDSRWILKE